MIPASRPSSLNSSLFLPIEAAIILVELGALSVPAHAYSFAGGTGEPNDPYQIAAAEELIAVGSDSALRAKHFILAADVDLSGRTFSQAVIPALSGTFDGNGHTIRGVTIRGADRLGLWGELLSGALVRDLTLQDVNVAGGEFVRGLVGCNSGSAINCYVSGTVSGTIRFAGGLVGLSDGRMVNCSSECRVDGASYVGGLAGRVTNAIVGCHSTGPVKGNDHIGGLTGENTGWVSGCFSTSAVNGAADYVGGLIGTNWTCVVGSWATGAVTGRNNVGGLLGHSDYNSRVINCYSTSAVSGADGIGGLAGTGIGSVTSCYSAGSVKSAGAYVGGLIGSGYTRATACFWDVDASGQARSTGGRGLSSSEARDVNVYLAAGWDFVAEAANGLAETWMMPEQGGYPVFSLLNGHVPPTLAGRGTPQDPYLVSTPLELGSICSDPLAYYRLTASIDLSGSRWSVPAIPVFFGVFDGSDLTIRHLAVAGESGLGLFGDLASAAGVVNLALEDVNVVGRGVMVAGLAAENHGSIQDCRITGSISGTIQVGGLVGRNDGTLAGCHSECAATADKVVGGLVGENRGATKACDSTGVIKGNWDAGGLIGQNYGHVTDCRSSSSVDTRVPGGGENMGGLIGINFGDVARCRSTGRVSGTAAVGGLMGVHAGSQQPDSDAVINCASSATVRGAQYIGGLIGIASGLVTGCYSTGSVTGTDNGAGGLVGFACFDSSIINCYSRSNVDGTAEFVGGLVGYSDNPWGSLLHCYSAGAVSGASSVGGLVGKRRSPSNIIEGFWDVDTSGQTDSDGGIGLSSAAMKDFFTFAAAGWDFVGEQKNGTEDIWIGLIDDYPQLAWQHGN